MNINPFNSISKINKYDITLLIYIVIYIITFSMVTIYRYNHLGSGYFDLGVFTQLFHNTGNGYFFEVTSMAYQKNTNFLGSHFSPLIIIFLPLYYLIPNAISLLISQSLTFGISILVAYVLANELLQNKFFSLISSFIFSISFLLVNVGLFDFHPIILAVPLLLLCFYYIEINNVRGIYITIFLLILTKEHVALTTGMIGVYLVVFKRQRLTGFITTLISIILFFLIVFIIMPYLGTGSSNVQVYRGPEMFDISIKASILYFFNSLKPYAYLPLLSPIQLFIALPELLLNITGKSSMTRFIYHYTAVLAPIYFYSFLYSYKLVLNKFTSRNITSIFNIAIITTAILVFIAYPFYYTAMQYYSFYTIKNSDNNIHTIQMVDKWLKILTPSDIAVSSSNRLGAHFGNRQNYYYFLYDVPSAYDPKLAYSKWHIEPGKTRYKKADYVVLDMRDIHPFDAIAIETYQNLRADSSYELVDSGGYILVYKRIDIQ